MKHTRPKIGMLALAADAIRRAQDKGGVAVVDCICFPIILFATPFAYEADE